MEVNKNTISLDQSHLLCLMLTSFFVLYLVIACDSLVIFFYFGDQQLIGFGFSSPSSMVETGRRGRE